MTFWFLTAAIAICVALILVSAVRAARADESVVSAAESDIAVYKDQLSEVDRDLARGVLSEADADSVRTEIARRLLEADKRRSGKSSASDGLALPAIGLIGTAVIAGTFALYNWIGAPGYGDLPMKERLATLETMRANRPAQTQAESEARSALPAAPEASEDFLSLMERLRAAVSARPDDIEGLTLLAQNEARLGRYAEARAAQEQLVAAKGADATLSDRLTLLDTMVFAAAGYVSPEAETVLNGILADAPDMGAAQYYFGLVEAQNGRPDRAFPVWRRLLEQSPPDAPWVPVIRSEIEAVAAAAGARYELPELRGPTAADVAAAQDMSPEERQEMIQSMVAGLGERLATEGGPPEDWARLISALGVLGQAERASAIAAEAETVFSNDRDALDMIEAARRRAVNGQ